MCSCPLSFVFRDLRPIAVGRTYVSAHTGHSFLDIP
jgi:hypothetical protein